MSLLLSDDVPRARVVARVQELREQRQRVAVQLAAYDAAIGELEALIYGDEDGNGTEEDGVAGGDRAGGDGAGAAVVAAE